MDIINKLTFYFELRMTKSAELRNDYINVRPVFSVSHVSPPLVPIFG